MQVRFLSYALLTAASQLSGQCFQVNETKQDLFPNPNGINSLKIRLAPKYQAKLKNSNAVNGSSAVGPESRFSCRVALGDPGKQMPFWIVALSSTCVTLVNYFVFPTDISTQMKLTDVALQLLVIGNSVTHAFLNIGKSFVFMLEGVELLLVVVPLGLTMFGFMQVVIGLEECNNWMKLGCCVSVGAMISVPITIVHVHGFWAIYNCGSIPWARDASQVINFLTALEILGRAAEEGYRSRVNPNRVLFAKVWMILMSVYSGPMALVLFSHVFVGSVIFFPLPLVYVLLYLMLMNSFIKIHAKAFPGVVHPAGNYIYASPFDNERQQAIEKSHSILKFFLKLVVLIPLVVYVMFVTEAMARFYETQDWWQSIYRTWSERSTTHYTAYVFASVWSGVAFASQFV